MRNFELFREMIRAQKIMSPPFPAGDCALRISVYQSPVSGSEHLSLCLESKARLVSRPCAAPHSPCPMLSTPLHVCLRTARKRWKRFGHHGVGERSAAHLHDSSLFCQTWWVAGEGVAL